MKYDFEHYVDRSRQVSGKWNRMKAEFPELPQDVIPFSVADMEFQNAPEIMSGLREYLQCDKTVLGYTGPSAAYKEAVTGWMRRRHGWEIDMDWNWLCPGVIPALFNAVRAFTRPGEAVILFSPVYYPFMGAVEENGRTLVTVPLVEHDLHYEIDWAAFQQAAERPEVKLLLLCSPHNPVGRVWRKEELIRIAEICGQNQVVVVSDEIHHDLILPGHRNTVYASVSPEAEQNCVICTAPSKTFNLAGLQVANILIPNPVLRERFGKTMMSSAICEVNAVGYQACEIAYTQCEGWLDELLEVIDRNRRLVERFMEASLPQIRVCPMEGTYLQWWDCRELKLAPQELEQFMKREAYLFLDEGYMFGPGGEGFERINLACPTRILQAALDRLLRAVRSMEKT